MPAFSQIPIRNKIIVFARPVVCVVYIHVCIAVQGPTHNNKSYMANQSITEKTKLLPRAKKSCKHKWPGVIIALATFWGVGGRASVVALHALVLEFDSYTKITQSLHTWPFPGLFLASSWPIPDLSWHLLAALSLS